MNYELTVFIIASIVLVYGYFSKLLLRFNISGPMIFLLFGFLLSPLGFNLIEMHLEDEAVKIIAELALIVVLFTDSSTINLQSLKKNYKLPLRLLVIGLPLTILLSVYVGRVFFVDAPLLYIIVMALILAPTDAALGKAVVIDKDVPKEVREGINIESGLNDGIVFPLLMTLLFVITSHEELNPNESWIAYLLEQIFYGGCIGALSGFSVAKGLDFALKKSWIQKSYENLTPLSLAILTYFVAEYFGGNGFIAVFVGGFFFGNYSEFLAQDKKSFLESEGEVLILISFLVFGLTFIPLTLVYWTPKVFLYSLLSLTFLRMLPVFLSLIESGLSLKSKLFIGWFGPRGIASILYVMTVAQHVSADKIDNELFGVVSLTVFLSIILHGLSAKPLVRRYAKDLN